MTSKASETESVKPLDKFLIKKKSDHVNDCCDHLNRLMGTWSGDQFHIRRLHSRFTGDRHHHYSGQGYSRAAHHVEKFDYKDANLIRCDDTSS